MLGTALVDAAKTKRRVSPPRGTAGVATVVAGGFAYVDGVGGMEPNATDAFDAVAASLKVSIVQKQVLVS